MTRRAVLTLISVAALAGVGAGPGRAAPARVTLQEFVERLDRARTAAQGGTFDPSPERMDAVRGALGLPLVVEVPPQTTTLPRDPLLDGLRGTTVADFRMALERLQAYGRAAEEAEEAQVPPPGLVQRSLDRAFRGIVSTGPSALDRVREALGNLLASALNRLFRFTGPGTVVAWLLVAGLGVAALYFLAKLRLVSEHRIPSQGTGPVEGRTPGDWRKLAEEALRRGDLREGIRALYHVLLATLDARGIVVDAPALTAGECRAAVRLARPALYPAVSQATLAFERVAYGGRSPATEDVEALRRADGMAGSA